MDILEKLDNLEIKSEETDAMHDKVLKVFVTRVYPDRYNNMNDSELKDNYKNALNGFNNSQKSIIKIEKEFKKRGINFSSEKNSV